MTPKEKAKELIDKFKATTHPISRIMTDGKQCALICVDEIIKLGLLAINPEHDGWKDFTLKYWQEVKTEIENL